MGEVPPALLLVPNMDAIRILQAHGVRVLVRPPGRFEPFRRAAPTAVPLPYLDQGEGAPLDAVRSIATQFPGAVLIPGSDGTVLWASRNREHLPPLRFSLPGHDAIYGLLNKRLLYQECARLGIPTPGTVVVDGEQPLDSLVEGLRFPVVVKPQGRAGGRHWVRAIVAQDPAGLPAALDEFRGLLHYTPETVAADPDVVLPLVQEYHPFRTGSLYHLCGFISPSGASVMRAKRTLLQYPRRIGNGLCFAADEVVPELRARVLQLCRSVGYYGVFEAEFLTVGEEHLLIDFNPRFYNGMTLEIARGMPLPWLAYLAGLGEWERLDEEIARADAEQGDLEAVFCLGFAFQVMLLGQRLSGGMTRREAREWRKWRRDHRGHLVDPFSDPRDPWVGRLQALAMISDFVRSPRYLAGTFGRRP
ncbi:MAG: hypothetical protein HY875_15220 [Chloroflexi bacterium]|nr:hypothetical protein [Chloroflexota bacterium]